MLALLGRLVKLVKKDFEFLSNYERAHPHFFWYLGADALLSVALVFGGYSLYVEMTSDSHSLVHVGAEAVTSKELVEHANENNVLAYWLGSFPGYEYTINHANPDVADIFYWQKGTQKLDTKLFLYEVKTYRNQKAWDARAHTILATANTETIAINKSITIRINRGSMKGVIVTFAHRPEIVGIAYPTRRDLAEMIKNVQSLELLQ